MSIIQQIGPAEATVHYTGNRAPQPFAQVTVLPCGLVHVETLHSGIHTVAASEVLRIEWKASVIAEGRLGPVVYADGG